MWLFEVHDSPRPGFRVNLSPGRAGVQMGVDDQHGATVLPLGKSLVRLLGHENDQDEPFLLLRAQLKDTTAGLCLVRQSEESARAEQRALVLIDRWFVDEKPTGAVRIAVAYGRNQPDLITYTHGTSGRREMYVFSKGDALYIHWVGDEHEPEKRFIIEWDGAELKEILCQPRGRRSRYRSVAKEVQQSPRLLHGQPSA